MKASFSEPHRLSERRGLHVTTDGVHLNERSGTVMADLVTSWVDTRLPRRRGD